MDTDTNMPEVTVPIPWNATTDQVQAALEFLPGAPHPLHTPICIRLFSVPCGDAGCYRSGWAGGGAPLGAFAIW